jgi:hypothetical protein
VTAGTLALWIGIAFALGSALAATLGARDHERSLVAARSLAMSAAFTTLAAGLLVAALHRADLSVEFVARHVTVSLPPPSRWLALFSDASGAGLAAAAVTGLVASWPARRGAAPGLTAAAAVTMLVLLAAPLAGGPLRSLPWLPVDGQGASPLFRHPLSVVYAAALVGMVASATIALGHALDAWGSGSAAPYSPGAALLAVTFAGWQGMAHTHAALAAGIVAAPSPLASRAGAWTVAVLVAGAAWLVASRAAPPPQARVETALATVLVAVSLALASGGSPTVGASVRAMWVLAAGAAAVGCWRSWRARGAPGSSPAPGRAVGFPGALGVAALVAGCLAVVLGAVATRTTVTLESGRSIATPLRGQLAHQGISRYDEPDATVLALALELRSPGRDALGSAEHREYADARGSVVGSLVRRPARFDHVLGTTFVWLDDVGAGDAVELELAALPGYWLWWIAVALLTAFAALTLAGTPRAAAPGD